MKRKPKDSSQTFSGLTRSSLVLSCTLLILAIACLSLWVMYGGKLDRAVRAAFPDGTTIYPVTYISHQLIDMPNGLVLVSEGEVPDAPHAESGRIAVTYLVPAGIQVRVQKQFLDAVISGSYGQLSGWHVTTQFLSNPVIYTEGGGTFQGHTMGVATLTEIGLNEPVIIAEIPMYIELAVSAEDESSQDSISIQGTITDIVKDKGFTVQYVGARTFQEIYEWRGTQNGGFVLKDKKRSILKDWWEQGYISAP